MPEKILVAVAWPYGNGSLHLGHIAGAYLPADIFARYHRAAGNDVLMVSGSDQHGTPDHRPRRAGGPHARSEVVDAVPPGVPRSPGRSWASPSTSSRPPAPRTTRRVVQDIFLRAAREGLHLQAARCSCSYCTGREALPARPLRRGHLPALRLRERARRPVRQLRPHPRPRSTSSTRAASFDGADAGDARHASTSSSRLSAFNDRSCTSGCRRQGALAQARPQLHASAVLERGPARPRDHPRPRLGRPDPGRGLRRQAHLRLVRGRHRLPLGGDGVGASSTASPDAWRDWWEDPTAKTLLLHRQGQHLLPHD